MEKVEGEKEGKEVGSEKDWKVVEGAERVECCEGKGLLKADVVKGREY